MPYKATKRRTRDADDPSRADAANGQGGASGREKVYDKNLARPLTRLYAWTIDAGIIVLLVLVLSRVTHGVFFSADAAAQDILLFVGYFVLPTGIWGRTIGKWVAGIVVVGEDGKTPGVGTAIGRELAYRVISVAAAGVGLIWIFFDKENRGWHDKLAGTWVVYVPDSPAPLFGKLFRRK